MDMRLDITMVIKRSHSEEWWGDYVTGRSVYNMCTLWRLVRARIYAQSSQRTFRQFVDVPEVL